MFKIYYVSFFSLKGSKVNLIENEIKYCNVSFFFYNWLGNVYVFYNLKK